jgi:hypothetical protein
MRFHLDHRSITREVERVRIHSSQTGVQLALPDPWLFDVRGGNDERGLPGNFQEEMPLGDVFHYLHKQDGLLLRREGLESGGDAFAPLLALGFPIVFAKFTLLRNYTFCHNEF